MRVAHRPAWTAAVASAAGYLLVLDLVGVNVALPDMRRRLDAGLTGVQWAVDAYAIALAVLLLPAGALADRWGRRRMFLTGLTAFTAASLACALAPSAAALDALRAVQGCAAAVLYGTATPLLAAAYPAGRARNRALGVFAAASGAAIATGPLAGGVLTGLFGWRAIFLLNVPVGLAALALAVPAVRESRDPRPRPFDPLAAACLTTGLGGLMWALIEGPRLGWTAPGVLVPLAAAVAGGAVLAVRRVPEPMIDLSLLRNRLYAANAAAAFAYHAAGAGALGYFSLYVQGEMGTSPATAGTWFLTYSLPALATPLLLGRVSHRVPPALLVALGPLLIAVSSLLLLAAYPARSWPLMVPGFVAGGLGGISNLVSSQVALAAAPPERAGVAGGITNTAKQAGIAAGVAVLGIPYRLDGLGAMLVTAAAIAALGALPALWLALRPRAPGGEVGGERAEHSGDLVATRRRARGQR
ncbi:MFS transporter [Actinomadura opuntiae]|uniref:MFS transporter n=1 Tax=Actinomadura sp. OS1-43 TaxID=604315 RepID=UPI00255AD6BE|nr:MFS transporter [Actinomadura sp. OS1-43]MDL4821163.1 MFS transporter [Actinomadura sp. OS1-43]